MISLYGLIDGITDIEHGVSYLINQYLKILKQELKQQLITLMTLKLQLLKWQLKMDATVLYVDTFTNQPIYALMELII